MYCLFFGTYVDDLCINGNCRRPRLRFMIFIFIYLQLTIIIQLKFSNKSIFNSFQIKEFNSMSCLNMIFLFCLYFDSRQVCAYFLKFFRTQTTVKLP